MIFQTNRRIIMSVGRPTKEDKNKKKQICITISPGTFDELESMYVSNRSDFIDRAIKERIRKVRVEELSQAL